MILPFWAPNGLNELQEMSYEFPFNLIGKSAIPSLTGQSCQVLKSWYIGGGPQQVFQCCFADSLNQKLISICGAGATTDPQTLLGRFIINHGEGSKNITFKMISHFFKLLHINYSFAEINYSLLKLPNVGGFPWH